MGAHEIPLDYREPARGLRAPGDRRDDPGGRRRRIWPNGATCSARPGVFTPDESTRILQAGAARGLKPRIHADELGASGGSQVAAAVGARSADHLIFVPEDGIRALRDAGVVATLLPNAAFYLKLGRFAPARALIDAGVPVALATDVNPGGGFSPSMPFAMTLACFGMGLTFEEALAAATINGAYSLDRARLGRQPRAGKLMDAVLIDGDAIDLIRVGAATIAGVIKRGATGLSDLGPRTSDLGHSNETDRHDRHRSPRGLPIVRTRPPAADRRRRWPARSARRCWRWWRACRSHARRPKRTRSGCKRAGERCAALSRRARGAGRSRQRGLRPGRGGVQEAEGDRRGEGGAIGRDPGGDARGDRRPARRHARLRRRRRSRAWSIAALGNPSASSDVQVGVRAARRRAARREAERRDQLGSVKDAGYVATSAGRGRGARVRLQPESARGVVELEAARLAGRRQDLDIHRVRDLDRRRDRRSRHVLAA